MKNKQKNIPDHQNPESHTGMKKGNIKKSASGIGGVISAGKKIIQETGIIRGVKALNKLNKHDGFDCPSCAWPDPDDERSALGEYCENGARAVADEATAKKLTGEFFKKNSVSHLSGLSDYEIGKKGRIPEPLFLSKENAHYEAVSWEFAFEKIAEHLNNLISPDEAVFYTSGRTSNEAAFLYQLFVREFGTNNFPDCSNLCHESSGVALGESLGTGKGSATLEDLYNAEVIMIFGQNPGTNHPRMLTALEKAKANGAKIISVNPLPETGLVGFNNPQTVKGIVGISTKLTDLFLQIKINSDMALLQIIEYLLLEDEEKFPGKIFDRNFINENTADFKEFTENIKNIPFDNLLKSTGLEIGKIQEAAEILKKNNKIVVCWAMGLTQHKNAVDTIKEIVNLLLLKGSIGKKGTGTFPVRGHSNVQGDRTMGINENPSPEFLNKLEEIFSIKAPRQKGYDVVESIKAMHDGKVKVFFAMGGNFLSASPDTGMTAKALRKCGLTVHVSTKLNRSHLIHGEEALILPCLGRSDRDLLNGEEQFVTCENSTGVVQASKGVLDPVSDKILSEPVIVSKLAKAVLGDRSKINWDRYLNGYDEIRNDIEKTIPGFSDYNKRVRKPGGFYLPNCIREGKFDTNDDKAKFNVADYVPIELNEDELLLMTIRSHDQFNTTIYGLDDRYRGIYNERRVIMMNKNDIEKRGFINGEAVDLYNYSGNIERKASNFIVIEYPIPESCAAAYFPETNVLVSIYSVADKSNTPASKQIVIKLKKHLNFP